MGPLSGRPDLDALLYTLLLALCALLCPFACWAAFSRFMNRVLASLLAVFSAPVGMLMALLLVEELGYRHRWILLGSAIYFTGLIVGAIFNGMASRGFQRPH